MPTRTPRETVAQAVLSAAALAALFGAAGTIRWPAGWGFVAVTLSAQGLHRMHVARRNPEALAHRDRIGPGTPGWDEAWLAVFWSLVLAIPATAGLGVRLRWAALPPWSFLAGVAVQVLGMALSARAMAANPFFEGTARIQADRGQRVVDAGPYATIRHPGYAGLALWVLSMPFLLLSRAAIAPAALTAAWIVVRTLLEDRMLHRELPGYADYAARVHFRLVPGVF